MKNAHNILTIEIPEEHLDSDGNLIVHIAKLGIDKKVELAKLREKPDMLFRTFFYGPTQISNDCHASVEYRTEEVTKRDGTVLPPMTDSELKAAAEAVEAAFDKRWNAVYSGTWRARNGGGESVNPVEREAMSMAREAVRLAWSDARKAKPSLPVWGKLDEEKKAAAADSYLDKNRETLMAQAKDRVAAKKDAAKAVDLSALGL